MAYTGKAVHGSGTQVEAVCKAAANANVKLQSLATTLRFAVDARSGKAAVKLVNHTTQEVVKQVPVQDMLAISQSLERMQRVMEKMN